MGDETKITAMDIKGKESIANTRISICHTSNSNEETRIELFHVRVISKHKKIDTLFDSGSQANLISDDLVKNLILKPFYIPSHVHWVRYVRTQTYRLQENVFFGLQSQQTSLTTLNYMLYRLIFLELFWVFLTSMIENKSSIAMKTSTTCSKMVWSIL